MDETLLCRTIAVTNRHLCRRPFLKQVAHLCKKHPKALILREKDLPEADYYALAKKTIACCSAYGVPCILHTYVDAARALKHPFLHLPLPALEACRHQLGDFQAIGCSVHSVAQAQLAASLGATYLTAGHIYETNCKKGIPARGTLFLQSVCESVSIPVFAIGGITLDAGQFQEITSCGAAGACIMSALMQL